MATMAVPQYKNYVARAKILQAVKMMEYIADQAAQYVAVHRRFPNRGQLEILPEPHMTKYMSNATAWGGNNGSQWGDTCGKYGYYTVYLDPEKLGLIDTTNFGFGCNLYNVGGIIKKICFYWQQSGSEWVYGENPISGYINQYEGGNSTAFDALHTATFNSSSCA